MTASIWNPTTPVLSAPVLDILASTAPGNGDALIGVKLDKAGAVDRTQHDKNAEHVTVCDLGASGNGTTNDSASVLAAIAANRPLDLNGKVYLSTPPIGASVIDFTLDYGQIHGGGCFKVLPGTYYLGVPGQVDRYAYFKVTGKGALIFNTGFDGNGQASLLPYQPAGQNVYFYPTLLYGNAKGQKAIANHSEQAGGHAIEGAQGSLMIIANNSAEQHNGIGSTNTNALAVVGNASANASDSHYYINSDDTVSVTGNVGRDNNGGGGLDFAGASNAAAVGNAFSGGRQNGIWILKSPNTGAAVQRNLIASNILYNNCQFPNDEQGEIQVGNFLLPAEAQGADVAVIGNFALPQDTPTASGFNAGLWVHSGMTRTAGVGNVFSPAETLISAGVPIIKDMGSTKPIYAGNVSFGDSPANIYWDANSPGYSHYANNVNMRIAPTSVGIPSTMESSDGVWNYHIVRQLTKAGKTLVDVFYQGVGTVHDFIDVTACLVNDNGAILHRIVSRGSISVSPTVLINTALTSVGTNPPTLTLDTSVAGRLRIRAAVAAAGFDNEDCAFVIRIVSPADSSSRFVPIFA